MKKTMDEILQERGNPAPNDGIVDGVTGCSGAEGYIPPREAGVRAHLDRFMDWKFGLMMHFGLYSELGLCESWPLSDGDASWSRADVSGMDTSSGDAFRKQYFSLIRSFNPIRMEPDQWADFAVQAGFRYFLFTTKHMDGFCLFDSKYTDFKSTAPECPFSVHPYADITRALFDAMRRKGVPISAYYCKPDLHTPYYWAEGMARPVGFDRNATYDPQQYPEVWNKFIRYIHNQVLELTENYGPLDVLWLDGAQVCADNGQDGRIDELAQAVRKIQPDILIADRMGDKRFENFITPEQSIPDKPIFVPWETCVTLGSSWGYHFDDTYKSASETLGMLIDVIARGGNLALDIGPQPDGRLPAPAVEILEQVGAWLRENGEAVYGTRMRAPYVTQGVGFTRKGERIFALIKLDGKTPLGEKLFLPFAEDAAPALMDGKALPFVKAENGLTVSLPEALRDTCPPAFALRIR